MPVEKIKQLSISERNQTKMLTVLHQKSTKKTIISVDDKEKLQ